MRHVPTLASAKEWIGKLSMPHGSRRGESWKFLDWHDQVLKGLLDPQISEIAVSMARGGGKTTYFALLLCLYLEGTLRQNDLLICVISSKLQHARQILRSVRALLDQCFGVDMREYRFNDSQNGASIVHIPSRVRIEAHSSQRPRGLHGLIPMVILGDEPAQWEPSTSKEIYRIIKTSLGKEPGSTACFIGTQSTDKQHWFGKLLRNEKGRPEVVHLLYAAEPDSDLYDWKQIERALPGIEHLPALERQVRSEMEECREDPSAIGAFRQLRRNEGVRFITDSVFCTAEQWLAKESTETAAEGLCIWGVDLSTAQDLSAVSAYWPKTGRLESLAAITEDPDLTLRAKRSGVDRELFERMMEEGSLHVFGELISDIAQLLTLAHDRFGQPAAIVLDRYREREFLQALRRVKKLKHCRIEYRAMRTQQSVSDFREFRRAWRTGEVLPVPSTLLRTCLAMTVIKTDNAGNQWCDKPRGAVNDSFIASVLAVSLAEEYRELLNEPKLSLRERFRL